MKGKYYVTGVPHKGVFNVKVSETKWTLGSAIRKAKRNIKKRGWKHAFVFDCKTDEIVFSSIQDRKEGRNIEDGEC